MSLMIRHFFFSVIFLCITQIVTYSQQPEYIRGKVIDSKTNQPLSYATILLKNSQVGIFTNAEGDFRVLNKPVFQSDSLIVTCIGYYRLSIAFSKLKITDFNI